MIITAGDMLAVIIALVACITLIITSAIQNARLTRARDEYRRGYLDLKREADAREPFTRETW